MTKLVPLAALLLLLALAGFADEPAQGLASPLQLIPMPREVRRGPDQPLGEAILVLHAEPPEKALVAAEEINLRLRELGAPALRVVRQGAGEERAFRGCRIELAVAQAAAGGRVPEPEQGYWIDSREGRRVRLVGRDDQGLLWAAITFRRMLTRGRDGGVALLSAEVRDWPDFPLRMMNRLPSYYRERSEWGLLDAFRRNAEEPGHYADAYVNEAKQAVDFLVRLKLNLAWLPLAGVPTSLDALARELGSRERADLFLATLRRVTGYARARGLTLCDVQTCHAGTESGRCAFHSGQGKHYCWSLDERNHRVADDAARFYAAAGYTMLALQLPEAGGEGDASLWDSRCKECKARWGDDRAAADAHLLSIWAEAFGRHAPDIALAAIQYPHDPGILLQDEHPSCEPTRTYWSGLHQRLAKWPNLAVCMRESAQPAVERFGKLLGPRPVLVYWMTDATEGEHDWAPLMTSRARFARTFRDATQRRWVFALSSSAAPIAAVAAAQYLWNADSPGAGLWPGGLRVDRDGAEPSPFVEQLLPRLVEELFGERAAPSLLEAFKGCVSPSYCLLPSDVARSSRVANTADRMQQQYDALVRASGGIERLWQRLEVGERGVLPPDATACFCGLAEQVARARVWASYHLASLRAGEAFRAGHAEAAIEADLEAAIRRVEADAAFATRMNARVAAKPRAGRAEFSHWFARQLKARYDDTDYAQLAARLRGTLRVLWGTATELRERPENVKAVRSLLPDEGAGVTLRGKGATLLSLVPYPTRAGSKTAIQIEGLTQPWHDGLSVGFPSVDVGQCRKVGGVLRFYINGGGAGDQQLTFWLYARSDAGDAPQAEARDWPSVALADFVRVDDLEATWQLVSIPLERLLPKGYTRVVGFGMNNATHNEVCGPVWLDTMYVAPDRRPAPVEVPVQRPPDQPAATEARVLAIGVQPTICLGANGPESRLMLGLKVVGNGALSNVRITLRVLTPEGKLLHSDQAVAAERMRTPWWSTSLQYELGCLVHKARLEMALASDQVNGAGSVVIQW